MSHLEASVAEVLVDPAEPTLVRVSVDASEQTEPRLEVIACGPGGSVPRVRNAWWTLRGHYPWWSFAVSSRVGAEALLGALGAPGVKGSAAGERSTALIDTGCPDGCVIRVRAHAPSAEGEAGWVGVAYVSTHASQMQARLGVRLRHAWGVLRGDYGWTSWDLLAPAELAAALSAAAEAAFPAAPEGGGS